MTCAAAAGPNDLAVLAGALKDLLGSQAKGRSPRGMITHQSARRD